MENFRQTERQETAPNLINMTHEEKVARTIEELGLENTYLNDIGYVVTGLGAFLALSTALLTTALILAF